MFFLVSRFFCVAFANIKCSAVQSLVIFIFLLAHRKISLRLHCLPFIGCASTATVYAWYFHLDWAITSNIKVKAIHKRTNAHIRIQFRLFILYNIYLQYISYIPPVAFLFIWCACCDCSHAYSTNNTRSKRGSQAYRVNKWKKNLRPNSNILLFCCSNQFIQCEWMRFAGIWFTSCV